MTRHTRVLLGMTLTTLLALALVQCQRPEPKSKDELEKQKQQAVTTKGPKGVAPLPVADPSSPAVSPLQRAFPKGPSAFDNVEALKYLPVTTSMVAVASDPQALLERLGRDQLTRTFAKYYEMAVAEVTQVVGENVLLPRNLPNVGIDPTGPVGLAMLQLNRPVGVVFWSLTDADRFKTTLYSVAGRVREKMEPHVAGEAMVICPRNDEEVCFVIKEKLAFLHFADMRDEEALAKALEFAARSTEGPSLATDETFLKTSQALGFGKDAAVYLNTPALLDGVMNMDRNWAEESLKDSQRELERAREAQDQSEIERWEERVKSDREWAEKERARKAAEKEMLDTMLAGTGTIAMGVELTDKALRFKTYTHVGKDSPWTDLARPVKGPSAILDYTAQRPFYLFRFNVDLMGYLRLLDTALAMEEMSVAKLGDQLKSFTGLDLQADILDVFSGEISAAVFGDIQTIMKADGEGAQGIGGTLVLGLADPAKAPAALAKLLGHDLVQPLVRKTGENAWEVPVPTWRTVSIVMVGSDLVLTTDPEFVAAMKSGTRRSFVDSLENTELSSLLSLEDSLGVAAMDFGSFSMLFFGIVRMAGDWDEKVPEPQDSDIPFSPEYRQLEKDKAELKKKVKSLREEIETETNKRIGQMLTRIGITVAVGVKEGDDFYGYGGHYIADESMALLIEHLISDGLALEELDRTRRREVWEMEDKVWEMDRKMQEVRSETIRKAEEKKVREAMEAQEAKAAAQEAEDAAEDVVAPAGP
jgi:hypothetical protein